MAKETDGRRLLLSFKSLRSVSTLVGWLAGWLAYFSVILSAYTGYEGGTGCSEKSGHKIQTLVIHPQ